MSIFIERKRPTFAASKLWKTIFCFVIPSLFNLYNIFSIAFHRPLQVRWKALLGTLANQELPVTKKPYLCRSNLLFHV